MESSKQLSGFARFEKLHEAYSRFVESLNEMRSICKQLGVKLDAAPVSNGEDAADKIEAAGIDVQTASPSATDRLRAKYPNGLPFATEEEVKAMGVNVADDTWAGISPESKQAIAKPSPVHEARLGSFGRMHVTEFLANLSKLFDSTPSIEGNVFLSVDKDLNVVPDKSLDVFTVIKCQFKSNVGLQKLSSKD